ncbi:MAG: HAD-IA family hydrolase [Phycisphaerales bacterium]|nr:HAD-IA family hydrolase [Phycisphaerales bacterium]
MSERPPETPIRVVCFDLGGVLIRICRSWREGCDVAGLPLRDGLEAALDHSRDWLEANRRYQIDDISLDDYVRTVSASINGLYTPEEIERIHHAWTREPYDGVNDIIDALHDGDLITAALSNTNAAHWAVLADADPVARLQHRCASHLMRLHKPDPQIYRAFERIVGHAGSDILFFEDTPDNADAARTLGWRTHVVDPRQPTAPQIRRALRDHGVPGPW